MIDILLFVLIIELVFIDCHICKLIKLVRSWQKECFGKNMEKC